MCASAIQQSSWDRPRSLANNMFCYVLPRPLPYGRLQVNSQGAPICSIRLLRPDAAFVCCSTFALAASQACSSRICHSIMDTRCNNQLLDSELLEHTHTQQPFVKPPAVARLPLQQHTTVTAAAVCTFAAPNAAPLAGPTLLPSPWEEGAAGPARRLLCSF